MNLFLHLPVRPRKMGFGKHRNPSNYGLLSCRDMNLSLGLHALPKIYIYLFIFWLGFFLFFFLVGGVGGGGGVGVSCLGLLPIYSYFSTALILKLF